MRLLRLRSAWGLPGLAKGDRSGLFASLKARGWDGVEASLDDIGATHDARAECCAAASAQGLSLVISAYSSWANYEGPFDAALTVRGHADAFAAQLAQIAALHTGGGHSPIRRVNAHSGSDAWSEAEARDYFEASVGAAHACGEDLPPVSHETHRGRYLCCPFATARLLESVPTLRLTSDFSHWIVKSERLLDSPEEEALLTSVIAPAVDHVHARIGTPQSPQVADVRSRATAHAAERHYEWWEAVWSAREAASLSGRDATLSATIEYGPVEVREEDGAYVGYTPVGLDLEPVAGVGHEETLQEARDALDARFERWHADGARRRGGW